MTIKLENKVLRTQTAAYIAREPVTIVLQRETLVDDSQGGWMHGVGPVPVGAQTFAMDAMGPTQQGQIRRTVDFQEVQPEYFLLGHYDADIQRGDWFYIEGIKYEVVFVHPDRSFQTFSEVAYRG